MSQNYNGPFPIQSIRFIGFLNSLGVTIYIVGVSFILRNGEKIFGKMDNALGPVAFLLLFVLSAAITGTLILGRPAMLALDDRKEEAIRLLAHTVAWLVAITIVVFLILILRLRL